MRREYDVEQYSADIEKRMATGIIVSDLFNSSFWKMYKPEYIEVGYLRPLFKWCERFYKEFKQAPRESIEDIFRMERMEIDDADEVLIGRFLSIVSEDYVKKEGKINVPYILKKTRLYFRKRALEILSDRIKNYVSKNQLARAEGLVGSFKKVSQQTSEIFNPLSIEEIRNWESEIEEEKLFQLDGALGEFIGWIRRGWLISIIAPEKRGKSFLLDEIKFQAATNSLKVLEINLEMSKTQKKTRTYGRLTGRMEEKTEVVYPVFDCLRNQEGSCKSPHRRNKKALFGEDGEIPEYSKKMKYKACTYCRNNKLPKLKDRYVTAFWYETAKVERQSVEEIEKRAEMFKRQYGDNMRARIFPAFSATAEDIEATIEEAEYNDGFVPDVLIIDYPDILDSTANRRDERTRINDIWKRVKALSTARDMAVFVVEQARATAVGKWEMDESDWSENKMKNAHIDLKLSLNQTEEEKGERGAGVARIGMLLFRHGYKPKKTVMVLQHLGLSMPFLDSEWFDGSKHSEE